MDFAPFLVVDAFFLAGLTWWFWTRSRARERRDAPAPSTTGQPAGPLPPLPVERILFSGNTSTLSATAVSELDALAAWLKLTSARLELTGSADDTGHPTKNRQLARARVAVAQRALLAHGAGSSRLVIRTTEPQRGQTERERQALRCVLVRVL